MLYGYTRKIEWLRAFGLTLPLLFNVACSDGAPDPGSDLPSAGRGTGGSDSPVGGASSASGASGAGMTSVAGSMTQTGGSAQAGKTGVGGSAQAGQGGAQLGGAGTDGGAPNVDPGGNVAPVVAAGVRWFGRVDVSDASAIKFAWSGAGFIGTFSGASVSVKLRTEGSGDIYFQPVIDGMPATRFAVAGGDKTYDIATGLSAGEHEIELYRESEGKGLPYSVFTGFAAGTPGTPPAFSGRLIEVIGDSISAGYGNLGTEQHTGGAADPTGGCHFDTKTESAYMAYGHVAARALNADASVLAGSGWGIYSDNGGDTKNVMPALFSNTVGEQKTPAWSFVAQPQAVVINLGTNDSSAHTLTAENFKPAYSAFIATVRSKYPGALIVCAVGSLMSGTDRDNAVKYIKEILADLSTQGDAKLEFLDLGSQDVNQGTGCDWHPSAAEDARMAGVLAADLKAKLGW
jgi:carbohydrate esterase-like protein/GDSL-like lipase/acylhydrolase family protein